MIGTTFNDGEAVYTVAAADGGAWIVHRVDAHESPRRMASAEIAERFKTEATDPVQPSASEGWQALSDANDRAALRLAYVEHPEDFEPDPGTPEHENWRRRVAAAKPNPGPSPEQHFARISDAASRRLGHKR